MGTNRLALATAFGLASSVLGVVTTAPPAHAVADPITQALVGTDASAAARVTASVGGSASVESQKFDDMPSSDTDPSYVVISTGNADDFLLDAPLSADDPDTAELDPQPEPASPSQSTDRGADGIPDSTTVTLTVAPPATPTANECLYIDFALATEQTLGGTTGDTFSIKRTAPASGTEYAMNAGDTYPTQSNTPYDPWPTAPVPYTTASVNYWHRPGDVKYDVLDGQLNTPRLERWTRLDNVTTRDTARVPLDFSAPGDDVIKIAVSDAADDAGYFDSAAMLDHVRFANCGVGVGPSPVPYGVNEGSGSIKGDRRVGYPLTYDPIPTTQTIERYDAADNGWTTPSGDGQVELRFRWYRTKLACSTQAHSPLYSTWLPIANADRQSYVPTNLDRGRCLMVLVTGVADGFAMATRPLISEAQSNPDRWYVTLPIDDGVFQDGSTPSIALEEPANDDRPGSPEVGETLTAHPVATRPLQDSWSYQWYADGAAISGATGDSLPLQAAQIGAKITVKATAHRDQFDDRAWTSPPTSVVLGNVMESRGGVQITPADAVVGDVLTAAPTAICTVPEPSGGACDGKWPLGTSFTYQWTRNGQNIPGATSPTYTTSTPDIGKTLGVAVRGSKPGYDPVGPDPAAPVASAVVHGTPMQGAEPVISGKAQVGGQLRGSAEGWSPGDASLTYSWYAGTTLLQSGVARTLTVPAPALGQTIVLKVTGVRSGYEPTTRSSAPTAPVAEGTLTAGTPKIYGVARVGQTLQALTGTWGPSGVKLSHHWAIGGKAVTGRAGRDTTFTIPRSARGKRITFVVTGRLAGYKTATRTSAPTSKVAR